MSDGFVTGGWHCSDGLDQTINGWHCGTGFNPKTAPIFAPNIDGINNCTLHTVVSPEFLTYPVLFPVLPKDLAVFHNGARLFEGVHYSFDQLTNSITLFTAPQAEDELELRVILDK